MRKFISIVMIAVLFSALSVGCEYDDSSIRQDTERTISAANNLQSNQPTPTDIDFGKFIVDGKVSSLNSYLTPDSEYYEMDMGRSSIVDNTWLADVDGSYGSNDNGIFFFTTDGKYVEWSGDYLYSDIPFEIDEPVVTFKEVK